jgi:Pathogenicity locus
MDTSSFYRMILLLSSRQASPMRQTSVNSRNSSSKFGKDTDELRGLANIGPAMRGDFTLLGIETVAQLAKQNPDELYLRLSKLTGCRQDPCVWDTFAAAIHQAKTGEARVWWTFTPLRKERQRKGTFI